MSDQERSILEGGPMVYSLDFDEETSEILIYVVPEARECLVNRDLTKVVEHFTEHLGVEFIPPKNEAWGFGPVLRWESATPFDIIRCRIPRADLPNIHPEHMRISASLNIFFLVMEFLVKPLQRDERQLLVISDLTVYEGRPFGGAGLGAFFTSEATTWTRKQPEGEDAEVTRAMRSLFSDVGGRPIWMSYYHGLPSLKTAGDCACLGVLGSALNEPDAELNSHNVDSNTQQLVLLVGLAALNAKIRRGINTEEEK